MSFWLSRLPAVLPALCLAVIAGNATAQTRSLAEILGAAKAGETIALPGGNYEYFNLNGLNFSAPVIVTSADPGNPAVFAGGEIRESSNITFEGVVVDYVAAPDAPFWENAMEVWNSRNIAFKNMVFDGDRVGGYGSGRAIFIADSSDIAVEQSEFREWHTAVIFTVIAGLRVVGNDIHSIRSDGFDFADVSTVLIEGNRFHDFRADQNSGDHTDMIQFWTTETDKPSTDIIIRRNILDAGRGNWTQSIFMGNELAADKNMYYRDVLIEQNLISNAHLHGITVGETVGLIIRNNTVLQNRAAAESGDVLWIPQITVADQSVNVVVTKNVAHVVPSGGRTWRVTDNLIVQNVFPGRADYYERLFVNALNPAPGLAGLKARPGSVIEKRKLGSDLTR